MGGGGGRGTQLRRTRQHIGHRGSEGRDSNSRARYPPLTPGPTLFTQMARTIECWDRALSPHLDRLMTPPAHLLIRRSGHPRLLPGPLHPRPVQEPYDLHGEPGQRLHWRQIQGWECGGGRGGCGGDREGEPGEKWRGSHTNAMYSAHGQVHSTRRGGRGTASSEGERQWGICRRHSFELSESMCLITCMAVIRPPCLLLPPHLRRPGHHGMGRAE